MQQFVLCLQFTHLGLVNDLQYVDTASNRICIFEDYIFVEDWPVTRIT